jgi:hypothetical protein
MVWQTQIKTDTGKLCAIVTQTQLVLAVRPDDRNASNEMGRHV